MGTKKPNTSKPKSIDASKTYNLNDTSELISLLQEDDRTIKIHVQNHIKELSKSSDLKNYKILILFDNIDSITSYHANKIYEAASEIDEEENILLILQTYGGKIEPAFLISKTCKSLSKNKFVVVIPRKAKSAGTLISLGADEIHMGVMSELGPIDPQFGGYPALGLANALNKIAELTSKFPDSSQMFASYLSKNLNLHDIGYYERVSESAGQYAERLLKGKTFPNNQNIEKLSDHFVNHYKDHSFVIDCEEALTLLGDKIIKSKSNEYSVANEIYKFLNFFEMCLDIFVSKEFDYVGSIDEGLQIRDKKKKH